MTTQKVRRSSGTRGAGERLYRAPTFEAAAALDLACDEASFLTGTMLTPDGGWSAG